MDVTNHAECHMLAGTAARLVEKAQDRLTKSVYFYRWSLRRLKFASIQ